MKKILSLTLAALMLAATLASCATVSPEKALDPNIRITSSDASDAAAWLDERLDEVPDRLVIGMDASAYGVDVSALEADGYIIRTVGDEVAILARTADGLDRAVRRYAKAVEAGESSALDVTYHEGYRVEELRLDGVDVSKYAIAVEDDDGYMNNWVSRNVADTFASLVQTACGAKLSVGGESERRIVFRRIEDESFKESSYHYFFSDGDLIFEYTDLGGARNGMVKFLEDEVGWVDLYYGRDDLAEADLIDVPAATDVLCHPRFSGIRMTTMDSFRKDNTLARLNYTSFSYKYRIPSAHHSLGVKWVPEHTTSHIPCLTDEYVFEDTVDQITENIEGRLAAGAVIGDDFVSIDLGMMDDGNWCRCKNCIKIALDEGGTWAGPMVYFANRVDEALDDAGYDGLKFPIFAYWGSNKAPKSAPNDDVYVTIVFDKSCTRHFIDGSQCVGETLFFPGIYGGTIRGSNRDVADWVRDWCALSDNVYARPAPLLSPLHAITIIDQTYEDIVFLSECGVKCIYDEIYTKEELDTHLIVTELWEAMLFDTDMSRAEFYEEVARLFEKYYGDGWQDAWDYICCLETAENAVDDCWTAWGSYSFVISPDQYDPLVYASLWERMLDGLSAAERAANSAAQERRVKLLRAAALYGGCYASYYFAYEDYDDERLAMLEERWTEMIAIMKECGVYDSLMSGSGKSHYYDDGHFFFDTLEETAWNGAWALNSSDRITLLKMGGISPSRPAPEKYKSE